MQQRNAKHDENTNQKWEKQRKIFPVAGNNMITAITADLLIFPWPWRQYRAKRDDSFAIGACSIHSNQTVGYGF